MFLDSNINLPNDLYNPYKQPDNRNTPTIIKIAASMDTGKTFGGLKSNNRPKIQANPIEIIKIPPAPISNHLFMPIPKDNICRFSLNKSCNNLKLNTLCNRIYCSAIASQIFQLFNNKLFS